jgi:hypothetical protein
MSKVTVALGSFIVGACSMFLVLSGNHASTLEQPVLAQAPLFDAGGVPVVPPIKMRLDNMTLKGLVYQLDGLSCDRCTFVDMTLTYAGGAFSFANCKFDGTTRVVLSGAAANTLSVLPLLEALTKGVPPKPPIPKKPTEQTATAKQLMTISFASPY